MVDGRMAVGDINVKKKLTNKQRQFVFEYLKDFQLVRAYLEVFPKSENPRVEAWKFIKEFDDVREAITDYIKMGEQAAFMSKERMMLTLASYIDNPATPVKIKLLAIGKAAEVQQKWNVPELSTGNLTVNIYGPETDE